MEAVKRAYLSSKSLIDSTILHGFHMEKVVGSIPGQVRAFLCGVCMFSLFFFGRFSFLHHYKHVQ